ncbi:MAG: iron complex outermembrane receptor protein, partial [Candidatus Azotimanducaceae bacterium]
LPVLAADDRVLEEIIVTGTKRAISQQDTPIAVSTLSSDQIDKTFGNDIRVVADLAPNVNLTVQTGFNAVAGGIRGTGSLSILTTQDPSVGILIDDFALGHVQSQFVELYDLEQVEIYRGPQGTLFGKNSTGGVIAITSKRPDMNEFGGEVKVSAGSYLGVGDDADNYKIQAAVDIPLIPGELAFRFAGSQTEEDGYYTNDKDTATFNPGSGLGFDPNTVGGGESLGGKDVFAAKAKLLWQPNDDFEAYFLWEIVRDRSAAPPGINETPEGEGFLFPLLGFPGIHEAGHSDPFSTGMTNQAAGINIQNGHQVDVDGYYMNLTYNFDNYTVKSITGYREQEEALPSTYTGEAFISLFDATRNLEREQIQQEFRLVTEFDGPLNFVTGAIYTTDDLAFRSYATQGFLYFFFGDVGALTGDPAGNRLTQDRESLAFYADGTYEFNDQWSLTVGARHTNDEKSFYRPLGPGGPCNQFTEPQDAQQNANGECIDSASLNVSRLGIGATQIDPHSTQPPISAHGNLVDSTEEWSETTWRVVVDYKSENDNLWYASVATGFLAGGFSETCTQVTSCISYDPETNINYEVGFKGDLMDGILRLNASVFYTDYEDLQRNQVFRFTDPVSGNPGQETITLNAGESNSTGLELEVTWLATDNLTVRGSLGYLDASYDVFSFEGLDLTSLDIPFASEVQLGMQATYVQSLSSGATISYYLSAHYQDDAETSPFDPNAAAGTNAAFAGKTARHPTHTQIESRTLVDLNVTYSDPEDRYHVTVFGKNLLDEEYRVSANSVANLWNFSQYGAPMQWGIEFGVKFN